MGLDSFWRLPEGAPEPEGLEGLQLCGGLLSGHGLGSFRGKVYNSLVEAITGVSLYQECIPNAVVREMAAKLEAYPDGGDQETSDLVQMFRAYADAGADLLGWW